MFTLSRSSGGSAAAALSPSQISRAGFADRVAEQTAMMWTWETLRLALAAGLLLVLAHTAMSQFVDSEQRFHKFIYERGPIQHVILGVGMFSVVLLYSRRREYLDQAARLRRFEQNRGSLAGPFGEISQQISQACAKHGLNAGRALVDRFHEAQTRAVQSDGDNLRLTVGTLPVLGLLGTMLGLSDALYDAFSKGQFGNAEVGAFVSGLSTALDTTVLAMLCAAPLFIWTTVQIGQQSRLVDRCAESLLRRFGLTDLGQGDRETQGMHAELCRLTKQIGEDAKQMFTDLLGTSASAMRQALGEAVREHLADQHAQQAEAARAADERIAEQVQQAARVVWLALEKQNRDLAEQLNRAIAQNTQAVVQHVGQPLQNAARAIDERLERMDHQVGRLESTLRNRTPEEVVIRYRENGKLPQQGA